METGCKKPFRLFDELGAFVPQFHCNWAVPPILFVDEALRLAGDQQVTVFEWPEDDVVFEFQHLGRLAQIVPQVQDVGRDLGHVITGPSDAPKGEFIIPIH